MSNFMQKVYDTINGFILALTGTSKPAKKKKKVVKKKTKKKTKKKSKK